MPLNTDANNKRNNIIKIVIERTNFGTKFEKFCRNFVFSLYLQLKKEISQPHNNHRHRNAQCQIFGLCLIAFYVKSGTLKAVSSGHIIAVAFIPF